MCGEIRGEIIENPPVKALYRTPENHTVAHMSDVTVPARGARLVSKLLSREVDQEGQTSEDDHEVQGKEDEVLTETYADGLAVHASRAVFGIALVTLMLAVMWALEVIDYVTADDTSDVSKLERWGIRAHHVSDLPHIFTAPFLHAGLPHLMANSLPFLVLGFLASIRGVGKFVVMNLVVIVTSGVGIWLFGPTDAVTLGASILIFGYFGYLVGRGVFERHIVDAVMAIAVVVFYGTMVGGVLPNNPNVSWQGHLFGLLGGLISAYALRRRRSTAPESPATDARPKAEKAAKTRAANDTKTPAKDAKASNGKAAKAPKGRETKANKDKDGKEVKTAGGSRRR